MNKRIRSAFHHGVALVALLALNWVFIHVWNGYGYWVWYSGGSSSGSW